MNANEIIVGKDYIIKIAHNNVKVKVLSHSGHSWIVKTAGGKIMPIQMADRFVRQVTPASEVPLQTPAAPAEAEEPIVPPAPISAPVPPPVSAPAEPATPASVTTEKKLSMLDAAAKVLETATAPMMVKEILAAMEEAGLWKPGKGITPVNSLVAAISTELKRKPKPRFRKTAPGKFEYAGARENE